MDEIAAGLTQSVAATVQARALAEDLKKQADRLAVIVGRFRLGEK
jgi:methyl-accepting chemotaxis protein